MTGPRIQKKPLHPADVTRARQLYVAAKLPLKMIAQRLGVSTETVTTALRDAGVEIDSKRRAYTPRT